MNPLHYFFGNDKQRAKFIFDFIAPLYGQLDKAVQEGYARISSKLNNHTPLKDFSILDIGTGTGGWLASIAVHSEKEKKGIDFSDKMIIQAKKNHPNLIFSKIDAENMSIIKDKSYDIVTASFVLHGMKAKERNIVLEEMKRIARKYVMIHDFRNKTAPFVQVLEFLERSDYKNFKKNFEKEMDSNFESTDILECNNGNAVYIGKMDEL
jgi:ubiquinone/menaquinone biosynthesis C-methylase UbiE